MGGGARIWVGHKRMSGGSLEEKLRGKCQGLRQNHAVPP